MTPVAAYYLFLADEKRRAAENELRQSRPPRPSRTSLLARLRAVVAVRQQPSRRRAT